MRWPSGSFSALAMVSIGLVVTACAPDGTAAENVGSPFVLRLEAGSEIIDVVADSRFDHWLNSVQEGDPPAPSEWHTINASKLAVSTVRIEIVNCDVLDLLEFVRYDAGVDSSGIPIDYEYLPICGPEAEIRCAGDAWGETTQEINESFAKDLFGDVGYFALTGICLAQHNPEARSFVFFMESSA